jgi:hypothetical protein
VHSSSDLHAAASRENGAQSHGPVTPEGKQRSSQNAVKHGLSSRRILVAGESEEDLQFLRVSWMRQLQPYTPAEREVVEEVVAAEWRIRRCQEAEASLLSAEIRKLNSESIGEAFKSLAENSRALDLLHRYMTAAQRDFDRALKRYHEVIAHRSAEERRDKVEDPLSPGGFQSKWGLDPDFAIISYCGRLDDVLPNEPALSGILTAAVAPFTTKPTSTTTATAQKTA